MLSEGELSPLAILSEGVHPPSVILSEGRKAEVERSSPALIRLSSPRMEPYKDRSQLPVLDRVEAR